MRKKNGKKSNNKKNKHLVKKNNKKRKAVLFVVIGFIVTVSVLVGGMIGYFYSTNEVHQKLKSIYREVNLPVSSIDGDRSLTSRELFQDTDAVRKFYESKDYQEVGGRVDFSTKEGQIRLRIKEKDVFNKLVENIIIQKVAQSKGIKITEKDVDDAVEASLLKSNSDYKKLAINLKTNYGWSINQFKNKIVKNQLYLDELFRWYKNVLKDTSEYKRVEIIKQSISDSGDNFIETVGNFSDGDSAKQGGEIAWIEKGDIIPEVATVLESMNVGDISDIIVSPLGMHIVMLEGKKDIKDDSATGKEEFQLRQIFIREKNFVDWIQEQKKQAKVNIFLREYQWNVDIGEVEFSNPKIKEIVKKVKEMSQGDPSL